MWCNSIIFSIKAVHGSLNIIGGNMLLNLISILSRIIHLELFFYSHKRYNIMLDMVLIKM